jgi:hypothetical protein
LVEVPTQRFLDDVRDGSEWIVQDNEQSDDVLLQGMLLVKGDVK